MEVAQSQNPDHEFERLSTLPESYQFVDQVYQFIELTGWSQKQLARAAGISPAALSQFLGNEYRGDSGKVKKKLVDVIESEKGRMTTKTINPQFIKTSISERFYSIAKMCRMFNEIGVCYADAGLGKTESARQYSGEEPTTILIEADPGYTPTVLFREIYAKINGAGSHNLHNTFNECVDRLNGSNRLLIIDEAEQLPYKSLEMMRRLHDKAKIGILLTGMHKLLENLRGYRGQYAQLYSRVGFRTKLKSLTEKDTENIVKRQLGDTNGQWRIFHKESKGNTRMLFKLIRNSIHLSDINKCPIDTQVILTARDMMLGGGNNGE